MDPDLPVLIKTVQARLGIVAHGSKCLSDGTETINQQVTVGQPRVAEHVGHAEGVQRRSAAIGRRFASQFEEHLRQQEINP
jgi:hypothetical protein